MPTPAMRPVVLVRQIRFCGLGVVIGVVVGLLIPWVGIAIVACSLGLMATLIARFRRSGSGRVDPLAGLPMTTAPSP